MYNYPPTDLLTYFDNSDNMDNEEFILSIRQSIEEYISLYKFNAKIDKIKSSTLSLVVEIVFDDVKKEREFMKMQSDFEMAIGGYSVLVKPNPLISTSLIISINPLVRRYIGLRNLLESVEYQSNKSDLCIAAGMDYFGTPLLIDIKQLPHLLVAGTTGSGKTVFLDAIIMSLMYHSSPDDVKIVLIDPKGVDLALYNGIPHLIGPVAFGTSIDRSTDVFNTLDWVETEMNRRIQILFQSKGVANFENYNELPGVEKLPSIVVIIDEYAQLIMDYREDIESIICNLARNGRLSGIHIILATQRPTADIITGNIKNNFLAQATFAVMDSADSTKVFGKSAKRLLGNGDMSFNYSKNKNSTNAQAAYVSTKEIQRVVKWVIDNN